MGKDLQDGGNHSGERDQGKVDFVFEDLLVGVRKAETHEEVAEQLEDVNAQVDTPALALPPNLENLAFGEVVHDFGPEQLFHFEGPQKERQVQNDREQVADQPKGKAHLPEPGQPTSAP